MKRLSQDEWKERAKKVHGENYDYSLVIYLKGRAKVKIVCRAHGVFLQWADSHLRGVGCATCAIEKATSSTDEFVLKAKQIHGDLFDYSRVVYVNTQTRVIIGCRVHGEFEQRPCNHLQGQGCMQCRDDSYRITMEEFLERAAIIHQGKFGYAKTVLSKDTTKIIITCPFHGDFEQKYQAHLRGQGCIRCQAQQCALSTEEFIARASIVHSGRYDYQLTQYTVAHAFVSIICPVHGQFEQEANNHMRGHGCERCRSTISNMEEEWLEECGLPLDRNHRQVYVCGKRVDGFDSKTNTVYEFYGDYWHGNPNMFSPNEINSTNKKTFGELYSLTMAREKCLQSAGYKLIVMWESEYKRLHKVR